MVYFPSDVEMAIRRKCKRLRHSDKTAKAYIYWVNRFLKWTKKELRHVSKKDVSAFLQKLDNQDKAGDTLNQCHMALKFLFEDVMERRMWINIKYSKIPKRIQRFLSKKEVNMLIKSIKNHKHKLMVALMYSAGLRVSEIVNLKIEDLNFKDNYGFVRSGKGNKDRIFVLSEKLRIPLFYLCLNRNSREFIFLNKKGGKYSVRTLQKIVKFAAKNSGIKNYHEVHCHTLRHSFATHLIEQGDSVSDVQAMLGHKNPENSLNYVHSSGLMVSIKSPFDND